MTSVQLPGDPVQGDKQEENYFCTQVLNCLTRGLAKSQHGCQGNIRDVRLMVGRQSKRSFCLVTRQAAVTAPAKTQETYVEVHLPPQRTPRGR